MTTRPKTLGEFRAAERGKACKVCGLPPDVLKQISARSRAVPLVTVVAWLDSEFNLQITVSDFDAHHRGRHGQGIATAARR